MTFITAETRRSLLAVGFLAATVGLWAAHFSPADGYELSIYQATPAVVWVMLFFAVGLGLLVMAYSPDRTEQRLASLLVGGAVLVVAALPLVRGYHFYGLSDALNHLGFARKIAAGHRSYFSYIYPGPQTFAVVVTRMTGWSVPRSMLLVVAAFVAAFLLFVPLTAAKIMDDRRVVLVAVVAAAFLMPINNIATTIQFHNFTLATLFTPVGLYLFVSHVTGATRDPQLPGWLSPVSVLMVLVGFALVVFHPLTAFDFMMVIGATAALQLVVRLWRPNHPFAQTRFVAGQAVVLAVIWYQWSSGFWGFESTTTRTIETFTNLLAGSSEAAPGLESRTESAQQFQIPIVSLFVRLLAVEAVAGLVVAGLVVWQWSSRASDAVRTPSVSYFAVGGVALLPVVIVQFHGDVSHLFFRHVAFIYVFVSILLGVALTRLSGWVDLDRSVLQTAAVVVGLLAVVLSTAALFHSPFIYQFNQHVPESQMTGFETAYEQQPGTEVWFNTYRVATRYKTALASKPGASWYPGIVSPAPRVSPRVPPDASLDIKRHYETHWENLVRRDHYLHLSTIHQARETEVFDGQRYAPREFESLANQEGVHRIRTGGVSTWYYVDLDSPEYGPDSPNATTERSEPVAPLDRRSRSLADSGPADRRPLDQRHWPRHGSADPAVAPRRAG